MQKPSASARRLQIVKPLLATLLFSLLLWALLSRGRIVDATESSSTTTASPMVAAPARLLPPVTGRFQVDNSPVITVTTRDDFPGAGAEPGETITYTIVVTNESITDALGVTLSDTIDLHTNFVAGSLRASPMAAADAYDAVGNTRIAITPTNGLLANDVDPDDPAPNPVFNDGLTVVAFDAASANGGNVTVGADGSFTYDPPAGFEGVDAFTYTIEDDHGLADVGTVTVSVSDVIWYVDHTAASGGDGRSQTPFDAIPDSVGAAGDFIFVAENGGGDYAATLTLANDEQLIGHDFGPADFATVTGLTRPLGTTFPAPGSSPTITSGGDAITLGSNNTVRGLTVGATTGVGLTGTNFGALTVRDVTITGGGSILALDTGTLDATFDALSTTGSAATGVSLTNVDGSLTAAGGTIAGAGSTAFDVNGGAVAVTYPGIITQSAAARIVQVQNRPGGAGTITFSGDLTCSASCTGINVVDNSGGTVNFSGSSKVLNTGGNPAVTLSNNTGAAILFTNGGLDIDTTSGAGFSATGGGTVIVTGTGNTVNAAGTAVNITDTVIGASGVAFESINVDGGGSSTATAVILDDAGSGQFHVTGTGAAGSGGTLQNILADAITLNNTDGRVIFEDMIIEDIGNMGIIDSEHDAIHGQTVDGGLELDGVTIRRISDMAIHGATFPNGDSDTVWNGLTITGSTFEDTNRYHVAGEGDTSDEGTVRIRGLRGTALIDGNTFQDGAEHLDLFATAGALDLTVTANDFFETYKEFSSGSIASVGKICLDLTVQGAANATVMVGDAADASNANNFRNCRIASARIANDLGATGTIISTVAGNAFLVTDHSSGIGGDFDFPMGGVKYSTRGTTTAGFEGRITGNTFTDVTNADGGVGNVTLDMDQGVVQVLVDGNTFHAPGNAAWFVRADATSSFDLEFDTNTYERDAFPCTTDPSCGGGYFGPGLFNRVQVQNGGVIDFTLTNEALAQHDVSFDPGNTVEVQVLNVGGGGTACASLTGNSSPHGYGLEESAGTLNLAQGASSITLPAQCSGAEPGNCVTVLDDNSNTGGGGDGAADPPTVNVFGTVDIVSSACNLPSGAIFSSPLTVANPRPGDALSLMDGILTAATVHFDADTTPDFPLLTNLQESKSEHKRPAIEDPQSTILLTSTDRPLTVTQAPTASASTGNVAFRAGYYRAKTALAPSIMPALATPGDTATLLANPFTLPGGETFTVTFAVTIATPLPAGVDSVQNQAAVMGSNFDAVLSVDPDPHAGFPPVNGETVTPINAAPDLSLAKDDGGISAAAHETVTYTLTYSNTGTQHASGVVITETVPAHTTFNPGASSAGWSCAPDGSAGSACILAVANVDAGDPPATVAFAVDVAGSVPAGTTQISNTADIGDDGSGGNDPTPADNTAADTTPLITADLVVSKSDNPDPAVAGEMLTYTVTITNNGPSVAQNVVATDTLTDVLALVNTTGCAEDPGGAPTCSLGAVGVGESVSYTLLALVDSSTLADTITNTVSVASAALEAAPGDESATITTTVDAVADLELAKRDTPDPLLAGEPLTFTLVLTNHGPSLAQGVFVIDTLPVTDYTYTGNDCGATFSSSTLDWTIGDAPAGSVFTCVITGTVNAGVSGTITNTAHAGLAASIADPDLSNNSVEEPTAVFDNLFTIGDVAQSEADGGTMAFTFTVSRTSTASAGAVDYATAGDTAAAGQDYTATSGTVNFAAGGSLTQTVTVDVHGDGVVELDETFFVNLSNPAGGGISDGQGLGTIMNDDNATLSIGDVSQNEGDSGTSSFVFSVILSAAVDTAVALDYATADDTATTADGDYTPVSGALSFSGAAGETQTVAVDVHGDATVEPDETFHVDLSNVSAAGRDVTLADGRGTGTVLNDDGITALAYLPVVQAPAAAYPDLVVDDLTDGGDEIRVVIRNQGVAPVADAFWVDLYLDPDPPPAAVNETWSTIGDYGAVWGVGGDALPLLPGEALTLTLGDAYYEPALSFLPATIAAGTPLYAQVDSANAETDYGAVLESHEAAGDPYNNIAGPVTTPVSVAVPGAE